MHGRTRQKRKKGWIWFLTGLTNWVLRGRWKSGNAHRENKQKDHQTVRWSKWGNRGESKMRQTEMLRGKRRSPPCQGRRAVFQARCFCAIWITAGSSCPGLVYKKLRQLLDFPHYCRGIGLIWCPSKFSAIISCRPEGTRSRRSAATCRPPPAAAHHQGWGRGWGACHSRIKRNTRLWMDSRRASKPTFVVLCQGSQRWPQPLVSCQTSGHTRNNCAWVPSLSQEAGFKWRCNNITFLLSETLQTGV